MIKKIFIQILFFSTCTNSCNLFSEVDLNNVESIVALLRVPTIAIKNNLDPKSSKKYHNILNLSVDAFRLANEVLSIINKNGELEFHKYDYLWAAYDTASLISHLTDMFNKPEDKIQNPKDIKKLEGFLRDFHIKLIPIIEGLTAFLASLKEGNRIEDVDFRLKCKTLNSAIRLFDNIIISKNKGSEQILYAAALVTSIIFSIKDLYEISKIKDTYFKEEVARVQAEEARQKKVLEEEKIRRQAEEAQLQKIRDAESARKQEEESRQRKVREEEQALRQKEEARLQKIRDEENERMRRRMLDESQHKSSTQRQQSGPLAIFSEERLRGMHIVEDPRMRLDAINAEIRATEDRKSVV